MENKRLVYRVILKVFAVLASVILISVFINSLFTHDDSGGGKSVEIEILKIDLSKMKRNDVQKVRLGNQVVSILYRELSIPFEKLQKALKKDRTIHSKDSDFYIYYNYGDSGNCPLFYANNRLKDTCSGKVFNTLGQEVNNKSHGFQLKTPPHYFQDRNLFLGNWGKE